LLVPHNIPSNERRKQPERTNKELQNIENGIVSNKNKAVTVISIQGNGQGTPMTPWPATPDTGILPMPKWGKCPCRQHMLSYNSY